MAQATDQDRSELIQSLADKKAEEDKYQRRWGLVADICGWFALISMIVTATLGALQIGQIYFIISAATMAFFVSSLYLFHLRFVWHVKRERTFGRLYNRLKWKHEDLGAISVELSEFESAYPPFPALSLELLQSAWTASRRFSDGISGVASDVAKLSEAIESAETKRDERFNKMQASIDKLKSE